MRPFWKCLIVSKTLVRKKLKFHPFRVNWGPTFHIWAHYPKIKKIKKKFDSLNLLMLNETILEMPHCQLNCGEDKLGLLGVLNTLLALSYPEGKDYDKKSYVS